MNLRGSRKDGLQLGVHGLLCPLLSSPHWSRGQGYEEIRFCSSAGILNSTPGHCLLTTIAARLATTRNDLSPAFSHSSRCNNTGQHTMDVEGTLWKLSHSPLLHPPSPRCVPPSGKAICISILIMTPLSLGFQCTLCDPSWVEQLFASYRSLGTRSW